MLACSDCSLVSMLHTGGAGIPHLHNLRADAAQMRFDNIPHPGIPAVRIDQRSVKSIY